MSSEKAKNVAISKFFNQFGYIATQEDLKIEVQKKNHILTPTIYTITVTAKSNGSTISASYDIPGDSLLKSPIIQVYLFLYSLLSISFIAGIRSNWNFYEIIYFSPMLFGFLYFKCCYPHLGDLLKKQADTFSFFLGMLTACSLSLKLSNFHITIFSLLPDWFTLSTIFIVLQLFCIFISVKFYISALDLLKSMNPDKKSNWTWLLKLLS